LSTQETILGCFVIVTAAVLAALGVIEGAAIGGIFGAVLGYSGKGVLEATRERD
jgi:outer membrane lipoprotein SlyB